MSERECGKCNGMGKVKGRCPARLPGCEQAHWVDCPDCAGHIPDAGKMVPPPESYDTWITWCLEVLAGFDYSDQWGEQISRAKAELAELRNTTEKMLRYSIGVVRHFDGNRNATALIIDRFSRKIRGIDDE